MYLHTPRSQKRDRNRSSRYTAKLKAKNRRRVNRMQGRRLSTARCAFAPASMRHWRCAGRAPSSVRMCPRASAGQVIC